MKLPFNIDLKGKCVVVTGGGGILCSGFAEALGGCGANVAVLDIRPEFAEKAAERVRAAGGTALAVKANVLDRASLEEAHAEVSSRFGACDILINGAGGNNPRGTTSKDFYELGDILKKDEGFTSFFDLSPDGLRFVFDLNVTGTLLTTQAFAGDMAERQKGTIVNISSMNYYKPLTKIPVYSAAKAAVSNFTQWLAVHFSKVNIRVNAIAPGFFITDQNYNLMYDPNGKLSARANRIIDHTPMGRFGEPSDLTGTLLWLCCDEASGFVNGIVVPVDGGFSAYSGV